MAIASKIERNERKRLTVRTDGIEPLECTVLRDCNRTTYATDHLLYR